MKISFQNTTVERDGIPALQEFTAEFDSENAAYAILGANGAGKSTLLAAILGLFPITSGQVLIDELPVTQKNAHIIRKRIGMVFQNADAQLFNQTVQEDVAFGPTNLDLPPEEVATRTADALKAMGVSHLAERDVTRLSGGEKRRVALAGILAMRPEAILLDEPTSDLDPRACRELAALLNDLPAFKLIATHDLTFARRVCPKCAILQKGRLLAAGNTAELLENTQLLESSGLA
jgi:cobalt/nickel transport system ATP-binding protein